MGCDSVRARALRACAVCASAVRACATKGPVMRARAKAACTLHARAKRCVRTSARATLQVCGKQVRVDAGVNEFWRSSADCARAAPR
eukprot:3884636-Pleurochrysis_carterae.AAC.4